MNTEKIKKMIANGQIKKAIEAVREDMEPNDSRQKVILQISAEFHSLSDDMRIGILDQSEFINQKRRIIKDLIELVS